MLNEEMNKRKNKMFTEEENDGKNFSKDKIQFNLYEMIK